MKKFLLFLILVILTGCGCEKKKIENEKTEIIIEVGTPSDAFISTSPISDTIIELGVGKKFKLLKTVIGKKIDNNIIIENEDIVEYKNNEIIALKNGNTKVYFISKNKKTISNVLNINVK